MKTMQYVVISIMPEAVGMSLVVFGPFVARNEAEEFLEGWIDAHPGTRGIVRCLIRPLDRLWGCKTGCSHQMPGVRLDGGSASDVQTGPEATAHEGH
jgi:hypothetical protein